jgi:hypothetical protein
MWYKPFRRGGAVLGWIVVVILMWVLLSLVLGLTLLLFARRRNFSVSKLDVPEPPLMYRTALARRLSRRAAGSCEGRARPKRTTRTGR